MSHREVVRIHPPTTLMAPCPIPTLSLVTWGEVLEEDMPALIAALRSCDTRMAMIRQWVSEQS